MTSKLCKCGAIVQKRCKRCYPASHSKTTAERGYGNDWRRLSERYRANNPLCERCFDSGMTTAAVHVHHVKPIRERPDLRLVVDNLMSVCLACHEELEAGQASTGGG
jgi:5-methylcytosine-specific restriction protein A